MPSEPNQAAQIQFRPDLIAYEPHRQHRPVGSHPSPSHWDSIRLQALERDGHQCRTCEAKEGDVYAGWGRVRLEVHHRHYRNWGKEQLDDVTVLCHRCHRVITDDFMRSRDQARVLDPRGIDPTQPAALPSARDLNPPLPFTTTTEVESLPTNQQ